MTTDLHGHRFRDTQATQVSDAGSPEIMEQELRHFGAFADGLPALAKAADACAILANKNIIASFPAAMRALNRPNTSSGMVTMRPQSSFP